MVSRSRWKITTGNDSWHVPLTVMLFFLSSRFGALADRFGPRLFMSAGPMIGGAGLLMLLAVDRNADYVTQILPALLLFGFGLNSLSSPLSDVGYVTSANLWGGLTGITLGYLWAHALAGLSPSRHAATIRGLYEGLTTRPARAPSTTGGPWARLA